MQRQVCIKLSANVRGYAIRIRGCNTNLVEKASANKTCLCFLTEDRFLQLIITPESDRYYTSYYYKLDLLGERCYDLSCNFIARQESVGALNTFYLTDGIYGLKINGSLSFDIV